MATNSKEKEKSIVEYLGSDGGHKCGYCKNENGFVAPGMWAHRLTVEDLQDLTDRGWRRSGKYCYKPDNSKMCCPLFIIRCDAPNFKISKSQKKVAKNLRAYLLTGKDPTKKKKEEPKDNASSEDTAAVPDTVKSVPKKTPKQGAGPDPSKPRCRKAKDIRRERKQLKQGDKTSQTGLEGTKDVREKKESASATQTPSPLEVFLQFPSAKENPAHKLEVRLVRSHPASPEFKQSLDESFQVYKKYQIDIHKDDPAEVTMQQYTRFLVDSPLLPDTEARVPGWGDIGYGSYHQQYYLDGRLIMVGVVDIFTHCLSSKYLYYDTDYEFLTLGVVSALNELKLTRQLHSSNPQFRYYCMGYYNHTCQKMRYKGQYSPSYLLCTETNTYVPIEKCIPKLDETKYTQLADDQEPMEMAKNPPESYVGSTLVLLNRQLVPYGLLKAKLGIQLPSVEEYAKLVGPSVASRAIMVPH